MKKYIIIGLIGLSLPTLLYCRTLRESLGFVEMRGNVERLSWNSAGWTTLGGGFSLSLNTAYPIYLEAYLDYLKHISPLNNIESPLVTNKNMNSLHFGGKTVLIINEIIMIKAGLGFANIKSQINDTTTSGNDFEINFSGGMFIPLTTLIDGNFQVTYRRLFENPAVNLIGGTAGILLKF